MRFLSQMADEFDAEVGTSVDLSDLIIDWWKWAVENLQEFAALGVILAVVAFIGAAVLGKKRR